MAVYYIVTATYLLFTITDGALRTITLLFAYQQSFTALNVAVMYSFYELAGAATNLLAGIIGDRWGLKTCVVTGIALQVCCYGMLYAWNDNWDKSASLTYVTIAVVLGGIAKDLVKVAGKAVTKLVGSSDKDDGKKNKEETRTFKLVSFLTGMKNTLKGVGYFLGSALISWSYFGALSIMISLLAVALFIAALGLPRGLGKAKTKASKLGDIFNLKNKKLNILSLSRLFLFASRDFWFEVPLPFYLRSPSCIGLGTSYPCSSSASCVSGSICSLNELSSTGYCANPNVGGGCGGLGMSRVLVGTFLALYIIVYGQIQTWTPFLFTGPLKQNPPNKYTEVLWANINTIPTLVLTLIIYLTPAFTSNSTSAMISSLTTALLAFAVIFGINSSIHSYLVVKYAPLDKVAVSVGFYYMSNAFGRLLGTLGSGFLYTHVGEYMGSYSGSDATYGLAACMVAGTASSALAAFITYFIDDNEGGLMCGKCTIVSDDAVTDTNEDIEFASVEELGGAFKSDDNVATFQIDDGEHDKERIEL